MKYTTLAAALLLSSTSAFAADAIVYNEPAPAVVADTFSWTGGYIGLNAGYAGGKNKFNGYDNFAVSAKDNASGFLGGIQPVTTGSSTRPLLVSKPTSRAVT